MKFEAVNNDTVIAVAGDIVKSSGQPFGATRALGNVASLAILGVWQDYVKLGGTGLVSDELVEVNCTEAVSIGDKLYVSPTVPGKATNVEPAYPHCIGIVLAKSMYSGVQKAVVSFNYNGLSVSASQLLAVNGAPAAGRITCVSVAATADNDRFTIEDGANPAVSFEYRVDDDAYATGSITCAAASAILDNEGFTLDDGVNPAVVFEYQAQPSVYATGSITCVAKESILDNEGFTLNDGVNAAVSFEYQVTPNVYSSGHIICIPKADILNNEGFTLDDGVNPATVFEYNVDNGTFVPTGGGVVVIDINAIATAPEVAEATRTAINNVVAGLAITAAEVVASFIPLFNDAYGAYNAAIVDSVANVGFIVSGMSGGSVFTPAGGGVVVLDISGTASDGDVAIITQNTINGIGAGTLDITASAVGAVVGLTNGAYGAYNDAIVDTVTDAGFVVAGMTGGYVFVPTGGAVVAIDVRAMTAAQVATATRTAINTVAGGLAITAGVPVAEVIPLVNDAYGAYNAAIVDTVTDVSFVVAGMTGGYAFIPTAGNVLIDLRTLTDVSATGVAVLTASTINDEGLDFTIPVPTSSAVNISNKNVGVAGNIAIIKTAGAFTVLGMANGTAAMV